MIKLIEFLVVWLCVAILVLRVWNEKSHLLRIKVRKRLLRNRIVCASSLWTLAYVPKVLTRKPSN